jgi:hypothetical protein
MQRWVGLGIIADNLVNIWLRNRASSKSVIGRAHPLLEIVQSAEPS